MHQSINLINQSQQSPIGWFQGQIRFSAWKLPQRCLVAHNTKWRINQSINRINQSLVSINHPHHCLHTMQGLAWA